MRALVGLAVFAALWQALFSPPFHVVLLRLVELLGQRGFQLDIVASVLAWAIAMGIAIAIAVPAGLVLGSVPLLRTATRAVVEFLRPIPSVALIPLAIVAMGGGSDTKIALAVYASVWPILFNTIYSMAEIDPLLVDTARSFGFRRPRILLTVALPHAAPFVFTGIRLAGSIALILIVSTEFLAGAPRGIGTFILNASSGAGRLDLVLAGTLVAGVFGFLVNAGLERLGRKLFRWQP